MGFESYDPEGFYDEMFEAPGKSRPGADVLVEKINLLGTDLMRERQRAAERALYEMGITFNVYGDTSGTERIFPFDIIPRIVQAKEWERLEKGLKQRIYALNKFIDDVYHDGAILRDGIVPRHVIESAKSFRPQCVGLNPRRGVWCHITGTDLVRDRDGTMYVLEDNLRCPSGVSYVLENRDVMKQTFPLVF